MRWESLTLRLFKAVGLKQKERPCLQEGANPPDCPGALETFVNAVSVSLRVSERIQRLARLAEKLDRANLKLVAYRKRDEIVRQANDATEKVMHDMAADYTECHPLYNRPTLKDSFLSAQAKYLDELLGEERRRPLCDALKDFNSKDGSRNNPGCTDDDIYRIAKKRGLDSRPIIHLAGLVERQDLSLCSEYKTHLDCLWEWTKKACNNKFEIGDNGCGDLQAGLTGLMQLVVREMVATAETDCAFLKSLGKAKNGQPIPLKNVAEKYDLAAAAHYVTPRRDRAKGKKGC